MKNVPNRIQNTGVFDPSFSALNAAAVIAPLGGGGGGSGSAPSSPTARCPTSLGPNRLSNAAANGAISPNSASRINSAAEMAAVVQPNSFCSGRMKTPGAPAAPAETSAVTKVTATTTQP